MRRFRVACIAAIAGALVATLTATAIAGPADVLKAVTKSQVKKLASKQADARISARAPELAVATAGSAGRAASAGDSDALGGLPPEAYAAAASEPFREVGAPGEPGFENGWSNFDPANAARAGFSRDSLGFVHLRGSVDVNAAGNSAPIFILPPGYRPSRSFIVPIAPLAVGTTGRLTVLPSGQVNAWCMETPSCTTSIDGVTFRPGS